MRLGIKIGLAAIILLYIGLAVSFSQALPFSRALDEGYHLEYITFIKQNGRLPTSYEERATITRADFPPLYHLLVNLVAANVEIGETPDFKYFWDSFRYRAIDHQDEQVGTLDTEDFQRPYVGRFLVWQIGRWSSIFLSSLTLIIIFFTLKELPIPSFLNQDQADTPTLTPAMIALFGTALLAFIPRYLILGVALNDDNLLGVMAALYFWMLVKAIKAPRHWWPFVGVGLFLGLSMTVKYTLVLMPLEIIAVCIFLAQRHGFKWGWVLSRVGLTGGLALLSTSWWFGWNIWFLNTVAEDGWWLGLLRPLLSGGTDQTLSRLTNLASAGQTGLQGIPAATIQGTFPQWLQATYLTFWGPGSFTATLLSPLFYILVTLMLLLTLFGLWRLWQISSLSPSHPPISPSPNLQSPISNFQIPPRSWLFLLTFHTALFLILPLIRFFLTRRLSVAAQGRHILIPAATAIAALFVWGLLHVLPPRWQRGIFGVIIALFLSWTSLHLYQIYTTPATPLPLRTTAQAATWLSEPIQAQFGEVAELVSYEFEAQPEQGQLKLNLAWRALNVVSENYLVKVALLDAAGQPVSHWQGYHGQGRLPTLAWDPGDVIFDHLVLPLPALPPGEYAVQVQLLGQTGPLPVSKEGTVAGESLSVTLLNLPQAAQLELPLMNSIKADTLASPFDFNFALWQTAGPTNLDTLPIYRYPGTISIVTSAPNLRVVVIDPSGQAWGPTEQMANIHTFIIGPRWPSGAYTLQFSLYDGDQVVGQTMTGALLNVENWWERAFTPPPEITVPREANFADQLYLLGYDLPQNQVRAGESFPLTLYWQAPPDKPPQAEFIQFNNLLDQSGTLRGGYDRQPLEYYNTLLWAPGEVVVDGYAVPVDADAPPGEYFLDVGYYLVVGESAVNLPLVIDGQMTEERSVTIGPITVVVP